MQFTISCDGEAIYTSRARAKDVVRPAVFVALAVALLSPCVLGQPSVKVSLEPRTCTVSEGDKVEVKLVIVTGSQLAYAGEFNVSYPSGVAKVSVEGARNWTVEWMPSVRRYIFCRTPQTSVSDPFILARAANARY